MLSECIVSQQSTFSSPLGPKIRLSVNSQVSWELKENSASITTIVLQYRGQPCWCIHFLPCAWEGVMRIQRQAVCKCSVYEDNAQEGSRIENVSLGGDIAKLAVSTVR